MDEGLLDSEAAMVTFLNLVAAEPDIARVPVMVDSSKFTGDRSRPEMRSGQAGGEFDLDEEGEAKFIFTRRRSAASMALPWW